jgi:phosphatidate cytidylyltransferase
MTRVLTSLVLIPIGLYLTLWAPYPALVAAAAVVACGCYYEYRGLAAAYRLPTFGSAGYVAGVAIIILPGDLGPLLVLTALMALALSLFTGELRTALPRASVFVFGLLYAFGTWRFALLLHRLNPYWLLFALVINWVGDISAFYIGRAFGKRKLAPTISPAKTWAGAAGSLAASAAFGCVFLWKLLPSVPWAQAIAFALASNAAGQMGDLAESAIKRGAGVKDSGALLPGHGGVLDRLDSAMFALPVLYVLLTFAGY